MKILYVTPYTPGSVRVRSAGFIKFLALDHDVSVAYIDDGSVAILPANVKVLYKDVDFFFRKIISIIKAYLCGEPITFSFYYRNSLGNFLNSIDLNAFDVLILERIPIHKLNLKHHNIIYDAVDCFYDQVQMLSSSTGLIKSIIYKLDRFLLKDYEKKVVKASHSSICVSKREADKFRLNWGLNVEVIPTFVSNDETSEKNGASDLKFAVGFHGKLSYPPNFYALTRLNAISKKCDDISVRIVGDYAGIKIAEFDGLIFIGYEDKLENHFEAIDVSVFPITEHVGISTKTIESLAHGIPVVVTQEIADGLIWSKKFSDHGIFVASIDEFPIVIDRFYKLSNDERVKLSMAARNYFVENYSPDGVNGRSLMEILKLNLREA